MRTNHPNSITVPPLSRAGTSFRCDFMSAALANFVGATLYEGAMGEPNWLGTNANSSTGLSVGAGDGTNQIGVLTANTGALTNGSCTATTWSGTTVGMLVKPSAADVLYFNVKAATTTASTDAEAFACKVGIFDTLNAAPANGIWFEWDAHPTGGDVHILTKTCSGGAGNVVTVQTTGVTAGTGYNTMECVTVGSTVYFIINGVTMTSTGTLPTAAVCGPAFMITKSAGNTNRSLFVDWFDFDYKNGVLR